MPINITAIIRDKTAKTKVQQTVHRLPITTQIQIIHIKIKQNAPLVNHLPQGQTHPQPPQTKHQSFTAIPQQCTTIPEQ